ncbi:beta-lactamase family protein [Actinomadura spongiicola]|uniref:beta-lactamase family protein n=1 Tax=Actinomadura spongiicola TaxID=2303421 RepID=UPI001F1D7ABC|nr:beta-lactamase family protein [Actinomadura spongiicola]
MLAVAAAIGGTVAAPPALAESPARRCDDRGAVRHVLNRVTGVHGLTGATVRVDDPRCGTWTATSGVADRRTGRPMNADPRFRVGSITKTFTATTVLRSAGTTTPR